MAKPAPQQQDRKAPSRRRSPKDRVRIRLQAYDHRLVDVSAEKIIDVAKNAKARVVGPIPLPTCRHIFCVQRSPHADKKSREHFELRIHVRLIDIHSPGPEFANLLSRLDLPAGVDIQVRL
ncbi:MAG: 30S ribosomal protein S10 [Vampirovibrionales bacterium]|nr:30S ribosomal protein S10 [Vampirovibrionales bacterium]